MRRLLTILVLVGAAASAFLLAGASEEDAARSYKIQFDNAFGLVEDGDFRVGGVTAGKTSGLDVKEIKPGSYKAVITGEITEPGFDDFREDATCDIKPQSLIGEYYVDCQPGKSERKLENGGTVPVEQTTSTIPQDLVNNILRRPYRERLRLVISELGTGLAGRPEDLAEVLRRAHPGLRETSRVLKILGDQNQIIENFLADADTVVAELEANKRDVVRWVVETGETAEISATRREELRQSIRKFPTFLDELRPTMARLGELADEQTPLLTDLKAAAPDLQEFVDRLGPFSEASRPALRSLGDAARVGTRAFKHGSDEVEELKQLAAEAIQTGPAPDQQGFARPLRQFLESLDERRRAVDEGPNGSGGQDPRGTVNGPPSTDPSYEGGRAGFTGFESAWNYPFWQGLSINGFDTVGHILRIGLQGSPDCTPYENRHPDDIPQAKIDECNAWLGPYQPGFYDYPDPSSPSTAATLRQTQPSRRGEQRGEGQPEAGPLPGQDDASKPQVTLPPQIEELLERLKPDDQGRVPLVEDLLEGLGGGLEGLPPPGLNSPGREPVDPEQLLDFLLAP
jgi:ABC-type transporter Mla subunit MlaD